MTLDFCKFKRTVAQAEMARIVKIFDIKDNLNDSPTEKQKEKYARALEFLEKKS